MNLTNRRTFLQQTGFALATAGAAATGLSRPARAAVPGAGEALGLAVIGLGNKGLQHLGALVRRKDVRVTAICDADPQRIARALESVREKEPAQAQFAPFTATDARKVFERPDVDAVMVVTGNHWHALLTVWGCQAGKDVYVEKPMTHSVWEGRKMIEAAARYGRIVQVGTQYRSGVGLAQGVKYIRDGQLGRIKHVHVVAYIKRGHIGRRTGWYPDWLDYDYFTGPAAMSPLERKQLHYDWHWMWTTGNGDLGNNGVHMMDLAMRLLPDAAPPRRVMSIGGRFNRGQPDVAETPNAQLVVYDYPGFPMVFENRGLPAKPDVSYMDQTGGIRVGIVAHCEGGYVSGLTGLAAYDPTGKVIQKFEGGGGGHLDNFLRAVRSRRAQDLAAPVEIGHQSAALCHYGNISYRVGEAADPGKVQRALAEIPAAAEIGRGLDAHLAVHGHDLARDRYVLGPWLQLDRTGDAIDAVAGGDPARLDEARFLLREAPRPPYVIPERV